jgi:ABC-type branched-subunit amino acid transport system ATPase component
MPALLEIEDLSVGYGRMGLVLDRISLSVPEGGLSPSLARTAQGRPP